MADELREWKPRNRLANALAGGLKSVNAFAAKPFGFENPPGEMLVNALALPQIANTLERYSYGQPLTNAGKANVPMLPSDTADALMAVAPAVAKWPRQAAGAALGLMGAADTGAMNKAAAAWHGSPHRFDAFDASKIGTGEGYNKYGPGTYLADTKQVAEEYANKFSRPEVNFQQAVETDAERSVKQEIERRIFALQWGSRQSGAEAAWQSLAKPMRHRLIKADGSVDAGIQEMRDAAVRLGMPTAGTSGALYKVDVPDNIIEKMIDWDDGGKEIWSAALKKHKTSAAAADSLRSQGIAGIRFLDQGDVGGGLGATNFVVFPGEESALTILERNGQPINKLAK